MNIEEKKKIPSLLKWIIFNKGYPVRVDLSITNNCNLKCKFCKQGINQTKYSNELSKEVLLSIVKQGHELGVFNWNILGEGEPLIKANTTLEVMSLIKKYNMMGNLTTNGTLFNEDIVKKSIHIGWDCINFSVDSADQKVHDELRGKETFKRVKNSLMLFKKNKKSKEKPHIIIHSIIHNKNYNKLKQMIDLAKEVDAIRLDFTHILPLTKYTKELELNQEQSKQFNRSIPTLLDYANNKKILTNLGDYFHEKKSKDNKIKHTEKQKNEGRKLIYSVACYNPWVSMIVLANGLVGPCCRYTDDKFMGNIKEQSLCDIWFGRRFNDFREKMINKQLICVKDCPSTEINRNNNLKDALKKNILIRFIT